MSECAGDGRVTVYLCRARAEASNKRKASIIQRFILNDVDNGVELYLAEVEALGGTPVWAGEVTPYVLFLGREVIST